MPAREISKKQIEKYFRRAVEDLYRNDSYLLQAENKVHEQAISHRLAVYLEKYFKSSEHYAAEGMNVDCEYNKNGTREKEIWRICSGCQRLCFIKKCSDRIKTSNGSEQVTAQQFVIRCYNERRNRGKASRPDILIHKRGNNFPYNTLIVEVKKFSNRQSSNKTIDKIKLSYFTCSSSEYRYKVGFYLEYDQNQAKIIKFEDGDIVKGTTFDASTQDWGEDNG